MGRLQQTAVAIATATVTEVHQVKLTPALRRKLLSELRLYAELKLQMDVLKHGMEKAKAKVEGVLGEAGESNLAIEGFKTALICAKGSSKLDPQKLIALGVTTAQIEQATVVGLPKAPYIRIFVPGEREHGDA